MPDLVTVKLGGSLCEAPELATWLRLLVELEGPPRLVVPGGGPFADAVRALQPTLGFDELAAHRMAILAMQQYGLFLLGRESRLVPVERAHEIEGLRAGAGLLLPWALLGCDPTIRPSWEVTSDSLALILARRLDAARLLLVKSAPPPEGLREPSELAAAGLVDPAFPGFVGDFAGEIRLLHRARPEALAVALAGP